MKQSWKKVKIETHEVDTAFFVEGYNKKFADFMIQNLKCIRNFHNVPPEKIVLCNNRPITKVKRCQGSEIKKQEKITQQVIQT